MRTTISLSESEIKTAITDYLRKKWPHGSPDSITLSHVGGNHDSRDPREQATHYKADATFVLAEEPSK